MVNESHIISFDHLASGVILDNAMSFNFVPKVNMLLRGLSLGVLTNDTFFSSGSVPDMCVEFRSNVGASPDTFQTFNSLIAGTSQQGLVFEFDFMANGQKSYKFEKGLYFYAGDTIQVNGYLLSLVTGGDFVVGNLIMDFE